MNYWEFIIKTLYMYYALCFYKETHICYCIIILPAKLVSIKRKIKWAFVKAKEVSSQILLLCAWRSVKELSLFLGELCNPNLSSLLTTNQILDIASFLMDLLAQTKHRGAFEQAYVAFTELCSCLWRANRAALHSHPTQLLKQLLESIAGSKK